MSDERDDDTPLFSRRQMSEAIQKRLKSAKRVALLDVFDDVLERLAAVEARLDAMEETER